METENTPTPTPSPEPSPTPTPSPEPTATPSPTPTPEPSGPKIPEDVRRHYPEVQTEEDYQVFLEHGPVLIREALAARKQKQEQIEVQTAADTDFQVMQDFSREMKAWEGEFTKRYGRKPTEDEKIFVLLREKARVEAKTKKDPKKQDEDLDQKVDRKLEYKLFWKDPKVADLAKDKRAVRLIHDLVVNENLDPHEAAAEVRKMLNKPAPKPKRDTDMPPYMHLEGSPESESPTMRSSLSKAYKTLEKLREKPPGERGSESYFAMFKKPDV